MAEVSVTFLEVPEVGKPAKLRNQGRVESSPVATYVQSRPGHPVVYRVIVEGGAVYMGPLDPAGGGTPVQSGYSPGVKSGSFASRVMEVIPAPKLTITIVALAILILVISKVYPLVVPRVNLVEWEQSGAIVNGTVKNNTRKIQKDVTALFKVKYDYLFGNELGTMSVSIDFLTPGEEWEFSVELEGNSRLRTEWLAADFKKITATPIEGDVTLPALQVVTHRMKIEDKNTSVERYVTIKSQRSVSK